MSNVTNPEKNGGDYIVERRIERTVKNEAGEVIEKEDTFTNTQSLGGDNLNKSTIDLIDLAFIAYMAFMVLALLFS